MIIAHMLKTNRIAIMKFAFFFFQVCAVSSVYTFLLRVIVVNLDSCRIKGLVLHYRVVSRK